MKVKYCKCKNDYTKDCDKDKCQAPYYWEFGIGSLKSNKQSVINKSEMSRTIEEESNTTTPNESSITKNIVGRSIQ